MSVVCKWEFNLCRSVVFPEPAIPMHKSSRIAGNVGGGSESDHTDLIPITRTTVGFLSPDLPLVDASSSVLWLSAMSNYTDLAGQR